MSITHERNNSSIITEVLENSLGRINVENLAEFITKDKIATIEYSTDVDTYNPKINLSKDGGYSIIINKNIANQYSYNWTLIRALTTIIYDLILNTQNIPQNGIQYTGSHDNIISNVARSLAIPYDKLQNELCKRFNVNSCTYTLDGLDDIFKVPLDIVVWQCRYYGFLSNK